jgi:uncharacterized LabA/DUF88 family protein
MRVYVYVDGFNLYYRALKGTAHKWLNPVALAKRVLDASDSVEALRYFTARVNSRAGDPGAPRRQQIYLSAIGSLPQSKCHFGRFIAKTKRRPLVSDATEFVEIRDTEEKGSDVNLASHLLYDAFKGRFETALVMSQDTDLTEPIRIVANNIGIPVGVVWLDGTQPNGVLRNAASFVRHITSSDLNASQFPNPIVRADGTEIHKPVEW